MWRFLSWPILLAALAGVGVFANAADDDFSPYVDSAGGIALPDPETVRARWDHLGTWAVQGEDGVAEFHAVYTQPGTIEAYREAGAFPDGAALVKEVRKAAAGSLTTGQVSWGGAEVLWFVMVKDRRDRFPGNPRWAEGWGWALFLAEDPATDVATDFRVDCMACHEPARSSEWVYTQGYPVLRD